MGICVRLINRVICLIAVTFACGGNGVAATPDSRTVIHLSSGHRALVIAEMHQFLSGLQQITEALSREDMDTVADVARSLGTSMSRHMPADLKQALPQGFREQGHAVHSGFDQIALDAEALGDRDHSLSQLGQTLDGCVACHNGFQIVARPESR